MHLVIHSSARRVEQVMVKGCIVIICKGVHQGCNYDFMHVDCADVIESEGGGRREV